MIKNSILRLLIAGISLVNFYLISYKSDLYFRFGGIIFIAILLFILIFIVPHEIFNILGFRNILMFKRFDWIRLGWLLPAGIELIGAMTLNYNRPEIFGLDIKYFYSLNYILLIFLIRGRHLILSKKFIKYQGIWGRDDSTKILWNKIQQIDYTTDSILFLSDTEQLEIKLDDLTEKVLMKLKYQIDNKQKITAHNNVYTK